MINATVEPATDVSATLPEVGSPIFLTLSEGVTFRSRLESVDGGTFTVAAPLETAGPAEFVPGHQFDAFWAPPRTRVIMPCRLVGVTDTGPFRWKLAPTAPPRQSNRREYVRGGGGAVVRLSPESSDQVVEGALLDISEGGLRCWIDEPVRFAAGDKMRVVARLSNGDVDLSGTVLLERDAPHGDPGQHLILTFDTEESVAQMIRLYIYAWEISERRLSREAA